MINKNKMLAGSVNRHLLGEVGLDNVQQLNIEAILGDKSYCQIFKQEREAIAKMWTMTICGILSLLDFRGCEDYI
jgi:hypothetical protein